MLKRLDNVGIAVRDVPRALAFYREKLGLQAQGDESGGSVQVGNASLYVFKTANRRGRIQQRTDDYLKDPPGLDHLAFEVADLDAEYRALQKRGVKFLSKPVTMGRLRYAGFHDPDGNMLYIIQRV
ncbi:MAG: VOC family protein [Chloroflexi bacterium]|nr:VOC family protein [Chloroflexota bacterium]